MKRKMTLTLFVLAFGCWWQGSTAMSAEPPRGAKETAMTKKEDLFRKIDALMKLKTRTPQAVAKTLGMVLKFRNTSEDELSDEFEARGPAGAAIERVELRGPHNAASQFVALDVSASLAVTSEEIGGHFGKETGIRTPNHHAPRNAPWYYIYSKPGEELKFGVKPGKPELLLTVILDRTPQSADVSADDEDADAK